MLWCGCNSAAAAAPPLPVTVSRPVTRQLVEWDEFTGQFGAVDYVEIRARVPGYLQSIHFQDGQIVQKGALLFVIDPRWDSTVAVISGCTCSARASSRSAATSSRCPVPTPGGRGRPRSPASILPHPPWRASVRMLRSTAWQTECGPSGRPFPARR